MYLSYERESYCSNDGRDLRITIDSDIFSRIEDMDLGSEPYGNQVLPEGYKLMEIKTVFGYPRWLIKLLSDNGLYKTSFSKYGNAYKEMILGHSREAICLPYITEKPLEGDHNNLETTSAGSQQRFGQTFYSCVKSAGSIKERGMVE